MKKIVICLSLIFSALSVGAQTTEFTYQGSLKNAGAPANGNYDFEFALFDAATGGAQAGSTITLINVAVTNGIFGVRLDFGNQFAAGASRFLEIRVRPAGGGALTVLAPRQLVNSAPFSVKSLTADTATSATSATNATNATNAVNATNATNATNAVNSLQLGGVTASQYVQTTDARLTDARNPLPNSANYIQNATAAQSSANFNISGNGTVGGTLTGNIVGAATQFNLGGNRILSNPGPANLFAGNGSGNSNTGSDNAFFGAGSGFNNAGGSHNSFFGTNSGGINFVGNNNSFFGNAAGFNTNGSGNSFFGFQAGINNTSGSSNTVIGNGANVGQSNLFNATALGANAFVNASNALVLGTSGVNVGIGTAAPTSALQISTNSGDILFGGGGCPAGIVVIGFDAPMTGCTNYAIASFSGGLSFNRAAGGAIFFSENAIGSQLTIASGGSVGIGTNSPTSTLQIATNSGNILFGGGGCPTGSVMIGFNAPMTGCTNYALRDDGNGILLINRPTGGEIRFRENNGGNQVVINPGGTLRLNFLGAAGATALCRNASNEVATCSSSIRYKENVVSFAPGLDLIKRLRPVAFTWKAGGQRDFGLVAEEVAAVEPLLTTTNERGETEGVKYDRVAVVAVNAIQEQQKQIDEQRKIIERQQSEIDALKNYICAQNPAAGFCAPPEKK